MEEKEIQSIHLSRLPNGNHITYIRQQVEIVEGQTEVAEEFATQLTAVKNAWTVENNVMEKITFSELTSRIADADNDRDTLYSMFERIWKAFLNFTETDKREAAEKIERYSRVNKVKVDQQYDRETGNLSNFTDDMRKYCAAEVELLGLTPVLNKLEEKNQLVNQLLLERNEAYVDNRHIAVIAARRSTDVAYISLVKFINASALLYGLAKYERTIDLLNQNTERTKLQVFKQTGQAGVDGGAEDGTGTEEGAGGSEGNEEGGENGGGTTGGENNGGNNTQTPPTDEDSDDDDYGFDEDL